MKKILITKKTSMISTFILTATLSYLLYNYTLLGVALASIYILATGILNCKYKTNNKLINYTSIIFATLMIIFISINNNLPPLKINMILIAELIFFVYYSSSTIDYLFSISRKVAITALAIFHAITGGTAFPIAL